MILRQPVAVGTVRELQRVPVGRSAVVVRQAVLFNIRWTTRNVGLAVAVEEEAAEAEAEEEEEEEE